MKKHDFESTSKKNAKEQTPEMAEREQEILMWMGDIRDDFILEAEDYKHYQSDKSVPGYFIVGGTPCRCSSNLYGNLLSDRPKSNRSFKCSDAASISDRRDKGN